MLHKRTLLALSLLAPALFCGCENNIGRAFDPVIGPGSGTTTSSVQRMVAQGDANDGRPKVRNVFPKGNGWPASVPIVVEFTETINESTIQGTGTPNIFVRAKGEETPIAASVNVVLGGRFVILRPTSPLPASEAQAYEVVVTPELRDGDGVRYGGSSNDVVADFTPDEDPDDDDAKILTVIPLDNSNNQLRETPVYAVFTKTATQTTVTSGATGSFVVRRAGGAIVAGAVDFPITAGGGGGGGRDGRIARFTPSSVLAGAVKYEIQFTDAITFGTDGKLDFKGRTPFADFETLAIEDVVSVKVGNPTVGFPDRINRNNLANLLIDVDVPTSTLVGDRVTARLYGVEPATGGGASGVKFVEASANATSNGPHTVTVSFGGKLGSITKPVLAEGQITIAAQLSRGSRRAGYVLSDASNNPELDVTPPTLATVGTTPSPGMDFVTDQEYASVFGTANEDLGAASLTAGPTVTGFGFGSGGRFLMRPVNLGRRTTPLPYTLTLTDTAGNQSAGAFMGNIIQRGVLTGSISGTLTVEAYDDTTLQPISGVTVLVEPGLPTKPASGRITKTTDSAGKAVYTGLLGSSYTVTLLATGFDLTTLLATGSSYVSLPMRPTGSKGLASLAGGVAGTVAAGQRVLFSSNIFADQSQEESISTTTTARLMPGAPVLPGRPYIVTAFAGTMEPTATPTFTSYACSICGANGTTATGTQPPIVGGGSGTTAQTLLPVVTSARNLAATFDKDFGGATGLDNSNFAGNPTVRVVASLWGIPGTVALGVGFATNPSADIWRSDATYLVSAPALLSSFGPQLWVSVEARDTGGRVSRHRSPMTNFLLGTVFTSFDPPDIGTITTPSGSFTGSPAVTYQDRLDPTIIPLSEGFGLQILTATDSNGKRWTVLEEDYTSGASVPTRQLPDLSGVTVAGLKTGSWSIQVESVLFYSTTFTAGDFLLSEHRRQELMYARSAPKTFTVN